MLSPRSIGSKGTFQTTFTFTASLFGSEPTNKVPTQANPIVAADREESKKELAGKRATSELSATTLAILDSDAIRAVVKRRKKSTPSFY